MPRVILLINVASDKIESVAASLRASGVEASIITGPYDIIAEANDDFANVIARVRQIDGVERVSPQFAS